MMCYHVSRFNTRLDDKGLVTPLKDQDRTRWNKFLIERGNEYLIHAAEGEMVHNFHIEVGIASVHANAQSFEETNWKMILALYTSLLGRTNNPMVALNRCPVLGEVEGPTKAVEELRRMKRLSENCHYNTSLGEMFLKSGDKEEAKNTLARHFH